MQPWQTRQGAAPEGGHPGLPYPHPRAPHPNSFSNPHLGAYPPFFRGRGPLLHPPTFQFGPRGGRGSSRGTVNRGFRGRGRWNGYPSRRGGRQGGKDGTLMMAAGDYVASDGPAGDLVEDWMDFVDFFNPKTLQKVPKC
eukprot:1333413-Amorphochlora_amoeboformis.AAC.1